MKFKQLAGKAQPDQIDLTNATLGTHPADRNFVNNQIQASIYGLDMKNSVRVASTGNVNIAGPGSAIDNITLTAGDRVLLKNQTDAKTNGIYVFATSTTAMTRATDADTSAKVTSQMAVSVAEGTANSNTTWKLTSPDPLTLGTTALSFGLYSTTYYATPTTANKNMAALATVNGGDLACNTGMATTPASASYVFVEVNGISVQVGNAVKTTDCYFSGDGGTTARAYNAIVSGDKLYWNGGIAGYQLDTTDLISFDYVV